MKEEKKWSKPEMIVLVRNNPEEQVLLACKHGGQDGPIPLGDTDQNHQKCNQGYGTGGGSVHCLELSTS